MTAPRAENGAPVASIRIELVDPDAMELWRTVAKVAAAFGEDRRWCLVGGLMVALFAIEAQQTQRATTDIDVLADARARRASRIRDRSMRALPIQPCAVHPRR